MMGFPTRPLAAGCVQRWVMCPCVWWGQGSSPPPVGHAGASVLTAGLKVFAALHSRSCPRMPASSPWSLLVFLNGSVVDLQHHVCFRVQQGDSTIYIVFIAHVCTWKTHLWYTAVHVCVIHVHSAFFFSVRWPHALPWHPELRTSQALLLRIRGAPREGPAPRGGWLQPPTAAAPREASPPPVRAVES